MLILLENARHWYDICCKKIENKKTGKILIFVSHTIDSLTSVRILVSIFQTDRIPYEIIPIENYNELCDKLNQRKNSSVPLLGLVIINCIGDNDLTNFWFYKETAAEMTCLVVDSRRPCNHKNINDNKKIIIINDDQHNLAFCPTDEEMDQMINDPKGYDDDEADEGEGVNGDDGEAHYNSNGNGKNNNNGDANNNDNENEDEDPNEPEEIKKKIKKKKKDLDINIEDGIDKSNNNEEENIDSILNSVKKDQSKVTNPQSILNEQKKKRLMNRSKIEEYYRGTYYGYPSTYIFYSIASQLHREDTKFLWYLIIAVTDEYLRSHFTQKQYDTLYKLCHDEVLKLSNSNKKRSYNSSSSSQSDDHQSRFKSTGKDVNTIVIESDYRLYLYRHWNLFDSFLHSYYPLGLFSAWKEQGREEIKKLFTYLGLPLTEVTQKYKYMKSEFKTGFKDNIIEISTKFELSKLLFLSFVYQFDKNTELSASDCVYLLSALLEYPFDEIDDVNIEDDDERYERYDHVNGNSNGNGNGNDSNVNGSNGIDSNGNGNEVKPSTITKDTKLRRFWHAYSFLSLKKLNMTNGLIDLAIKFQIALTEIATSIIDKRTFADVKSFQYTVINSNISQESHYFHLPGNLELLSLFVMELFKLTHTKITKTKPLLIAILNAEEKTYLLKGNLGCNRESESQRNEFGIKFKFVAKNSGIKVRYDYNTDDMITIAKDDLFAFIQEISLL